MEQDPNKVINGQSGDGRLSCWMGVALQNIDGKLLILLLILLIVPIFQPDTIAHLDDKTLIKLWRAWRLVSCFTILTIFFFVGRKDAFTYCATLFSVSVLVSTIINEGSVTEWVYRWIPIMAAVGLVATLYKNRSKELIIALFVVTFGMSVINLVSIFAFPEGTYGITEGQPGIRFFFGNRNNTYQILVPAIVCGYLIDLSQGRRVPATMICAYGMAIVQIVIIRSTTTLIALICLGLLFLCVRKESSFRKLLNGLSYVVLSVALFFTIVVGRIEKTFSFLIEDVLREDLTLNGRTSVWDMVFDFMDADHLVWGYGLSGYKLFGGKGFTHAHNEFLNVWYVGGFVGIALFSMLLLLVAYVLYRHRSKMTAAIMGAGMCALFVIGIAEQITTPSFFFLMSLSFYCSSKLLAEGTSADLLEQQNRSTVFLQ